VIATQNIKKINLFFKMVLQVFTYSAVAIVVDYFDTINNFIDIQTKSTEREPESF